MDYPEKYIAMHFVSQHAVELCGSVGQNEKTNTSFIWNDYSGGGDKKQKVVISIHWGGASGGTHTFFLLTLPFLRAMDSLVVTAAWNLN